MEFSVQIIIYTKPHRALSSCLEHVHEQSVVSFVTYHERDQCKF